MSCHGNMNPLYLDLYNCACLFPLICIKTLLIVNSNINLSGKRKTGTIIIVPANMLLPATPVTALKVFSPRTPLFPNPRRSRSGHASEGEAGMGLFGSGRLFFDPLLTPCQDNSLTSTKTINTPIFDCRLKPARLLRGYPLGISKGCDSCGVKRKIFPIGYDLAVQRVTTKNNSKYYYKDIVVSDDNMTTLTTFDDNVTTT